VKPPGGTEVYSGKIKVDQEYTVQVRLLGHRPETQKVLAQASDSTKRLVFKLEQHELELSASSRPPGATVLVRGRPLGVTPTTFKVLWGVKSVTFTKRCYDPEEVQVPHPAIPGSGLVPIRAELRKQPRCR
jgi:hypothetical protein